MVDLTDCDREPIHIPGTIQPYGVLLVLAEPALTVAQVSENVGDHFPLGVEDILGQPLSRVIDPASVDEVREALREERWYETNPLHIRAHGKRFDGIVHRHEGAAILELEPNPEPPITDADAPPVPAGADADPTREHAGRARRRRRPANAASDRVRTGHVLSVPRGRAWLGGRRGERTSARAVSGTALSGLRHPCPSTSAVPQELAAAHLRCPRHAGANRPDPPRGHGRATRPQLFGAAQRLAHSPRVHGKHGGPRFHEHLAHRSRPPVGTHQLPEPHRPAARFARDAGGVRVSRSPDLAADRRARGPRTARAARLTSSDRGRAGRCDARERRGRERARGPARPPEGADGAGGRRGGRVGERRGTCDVRPHAAASRSSRRSRRGSRREKHPDRSPPRR